LLFVGCAPPGGVSPSDGLVFVRRVGADTDLYRARLSDGAVRALWTTPERAETWPYWSEQAGKLVFEARPYDSGERPPSARGDDPDQRLLLFDPSNGTESLLSRTPALLEHWADWSPRGDRLGFAFSSHLGVAPTAGLAVVDLASGERAVAASVQPDSRLFRPRFSPDGRFLVAQRWSNPTASSKVWLFELGGAPRALTKGQRGVDSKPRFTRDGRAVVFTRRPKPRADGDIWRVGTESGEPVALVRGQGSDDHAADPSPTRDEVAFASNRGGNYDIWLADLAGGELRNLTRTPDIDEGAVRWSPDGERLVMSRTRVGVDASLPPDQRPPAQLAVLDRDGKLLFESEGFSPDWMPPWR
jgi:Tol biopolymer transport system component